MKQSSIKLIGKEESEHKKSSRFIEEEVKQA
jgi:hypothetical protein